MKRLTLALIALIGMASAGRAAVVLTDTFSYPPGPLVGAPGSPWVTHSGTIPMQVDVVPPGRAFLTQAESEDVNAPLVGAPYTAGNLYACFLVNFSALPTGAGTYFAHFKDTTAMNFRCKIFATTTGAAPGQFRVGIANNANIVTAIIPTDLSLGVDYVLVARYTIAPAASIASTLWINPATEASVANRADAVDATSVLAISGFGLRQSLGGTPVVGMGSLTLDHLRVATTFDECVGRVTERFFVTDALPPGNGAYVSPRDWHAFYANGIIISNASHSRFLPSQPPPPPGGGPQTHNFMSQVEVDLAMGPGQPFQRVSAPAQVVVQMNPPPVGGTLYQTEMLQLDIQGGSLPAGVMIRESPTLASTGQTTVRPVVGGHMIGSFFDIFTEVSLDGGANWTPAARIARVELDIDPKTIPPIPTPTPLLPPPNDRYVSPQEWHILYTNGIILSNASHAFFTNSLPPPQPNQPPQIHTFDSFIDADVHIPGTPGFVPVRAPAMTQVSVQHRSSNLDGSQTFDTEMLSLSISGGDLPPGIMLRESPTRRSLGGVAMRVLPAGTFEVHSFFDIWTEISLDGGVNWEPAGQPARVELRCDAPENPFPDPNLPPPQGEYVSPEQYHILTAQGIVISNVSHNRFTQSTPPPPPGGTQVHTFSSQLEFDYVDPLGLPTERISAPAVVSVRVTSTIDDGLTGTRFFETEMLQLDIQGGGLPPGMMIRESPTRASLGRTSIREFTDPQGVIWDYIASFFDIFVETSIDGGQNWSPAANGPATVALRPVPLNPPVLIVCPPDVTVPATGAAGAVVNYPPPTVTGGCDPAPPAPSCAPPSGTTFPVGTTTVVCTAMDSCGSVATCTFNVTVTPPVQPVKEVFLRTNNLPPLPGVYISPAQFHILTAQGIVIKDVKHRRFLQTQPPPPPGGSSVHSFGSTVDAMISQDNGTTFSPMSAPAQVTVRVTHAGTDPGTGVTTFDTEMLQLDLQGGTLPASVRLRESPTLPSPGHTTMRSVPGGYMVSSFFDVFTELSLDGGANWFPAQDAGHVELRIDPANIPPIPAPTPILPPRNDYYVSPALFHALFAQGIVIQDVRHSLFTQSLPPPPQGVDQIHQFDSQVDVSVSQGGGQPQRLRAPAGVSVLLQKIGGGAGGTDPTGTFDTEMLQLNIGGGDLPPNIRLRESPTLPSRGMTEISRNPDGTFRIGSFFDIFTELSVDGGNNWEPASNGAVRVELRCDAPEQTATNQNLPPLNGEYVSPQQFHALYANGIILSNASHRRFTDSMPPPPPGQTNQHQFGSVITVDVAMGSGQPFVPVMMEADVSVAVRSAQDFGTTRYFDTEMLALNLTGVGGPPGGVMVRESPTRASMGRTSIRNASTHISSFFDIFTEISLDGGMTWSPSVSGPVPMALSIPQIPANCPPVSITLVNQPGIGAAVKICWAGNADPTCILQATQSLSPIDWQAVGAVPVLDGGQWCVTLPLQGQTSFFRLCSGCPSLGGGN